MFNFHLCKRVVTISLVISLFTGVYSQCMLQHIAKTHSIVLDKYKHLSIANGAIGWETGTIRRLYDFGEIYPEYRIDKRSNRKFIAKYNHPEKTSQLVRLIHALFYRIPGTQNAACFGPTNHILDTNPHSAVQTIAKILGLCEYIQEEESTIDFYDNVINKQLQDYFNALLKPQAYLDAQMNSVLRNALHECEPNNKKNIYPLHMLQMVLLTFIYKKYSDDRNVLASFYGELNNNLNKQLLIPDINYNAWVKEIFKQADQTIALQKIETMVSAPDCAANIQKNLDEFVYYAHQIRAFPTPIGYQTASYKYNPNKNAPSFPDCMETALRNFMMMCAYDSRTNQCDVKKLQETLGIDTVHSTLVQFLETFDDMASKQAHDAWTNVISNLPFVAYHRMIDDTNGKSFVRMKDKGYVTIPETMQNDNLRNWLTQHEYQVCTAQQYGYELRPSRKNIIILLNHLLQLNLFKDMQELAQEFMRPDFVAEYFPRLCIALNAKGYLSDEKTKSTGTNAVVDVEAIDCTSSVIYTTLYLPEFACVFGTSSGHGEFSFLQQENPNNKFNKLTNLLVNIDTTKQPNIHLLVTDLLCKKGVNIENLKNNTEYINLFAMSLENTGFLTNIVNIFSKMSLDTTLTTKINIKNLLLRVAELQPDTDQRDIARLKILAEFVKKITPSDYKNSDSTFVESIQTAQKEINSSYRDTKYEALKLFESLVVHGQAYAEATQAATNKMDDCSFIVRVQALRLFEALVEHNQAYTEAIQAAEMGKTDRNTDVQKETYNLFKTLVTQNQAIAEATQAARQASHVVETNAHVRKEALSLFKVLVEHNCAFNEATLSAISELRDFSSIIRVEALHLFKALVERNQAFTEATRAAINAISDKNENVREEALNLFKDLFEKGVAFEEAKQLAAKESSLRPEAIQHDDFALFKILVEHNYAFAEVTQVAKNRMLNANFGVRNKALKLFKALFEKNQAFAEAIDVAKKGVFNSKFEKFMMQEESLELFKILINHGQAFKKAAQAAIFTLKKWGTLHCTEEALAILELLMVKNPKITKEIIQQFLDDPTVTLNNDFRKKLHKISLS